MFGLCHRLSVSFDQGYGQVYKKGLNPIETVLKTRSICNWCLMSVGSRALATELTSNAGLCSV